jgi:hypothetical protein
VRGTAAEEIAEIKQSNANIKLVFISRWPII